MKAGNPEKYRGLEMSDAAANLLKSDPVKFASYCNGVGSRVGWLGRLTYHLIPNTIWFLNITPASDGHDVDFTIPSVFESLSAAEKAFDEANLRLYKNICILIDRKSRSGWLYLARMHRAGLYYDMVSSDAGWTSFISGKTIAGVKHK